VTAKQTERPHVVVDRRCLACGTTAPGSCLESWRETAVRATDARFAVEEASVPNAGIPEPTIRRLKGHALDVSAGYYRITPESMREAVLSLGDDGFAAVPAVGPGTWLASLGDQKIGFRAESGEMETHWHR